MSTTDNLTKSRLLAIVVSTPGLTITDIASSYNVKYDTNYIPGGLHAAMSILLQSGEVHREKKLLSGWNRPCNVYYSDIIDPPSLPSEVEPSSDEIDRYVYLLLQKRRGLSVLDVGSAIDKEFSCEDGYHRSKRSLGRLVQLGLISRIKGYHASTGRIKYVYFLI